MKRAKAKNGRPRLGLGEEEEATQKLKKEEEFVVKTQVSLYVLWTVEGRKDKPLESLCIRPDCY